MHKRSKVVTVVQDPAPSEKDERSFLRQPLDWTGWRSPSMSRFMFKWSDFRISGLRFQPWNVSQHIWMTDHFLRRRTNEETFYRWCVTKFHLSTTCARFFSSRRSIKVKNSPWWGESCKWKVWKILCNGKSMRDERPRCPGLMSRNLKKTERSSVWAPPTRSSEVKRPLESVRDVSFLPIKPSWGLEGSLWLQLDRPWSDPQTRNTKDSFIFTCDLFTTQEQTWGLQPSAIAEGKTWFIYRLFAADFQRSYLNRAQIHNSARNSLQRIIWPL